MNAKKLTCPRVTVDISLTAAARGARLAPTRVRTGENPRLDA